MNFKKIIALGLCFCLGASCLSGCGNSDSSKDTTTTSEVEKAPETDEEWTQAMLKKSLYSYGNTTRVVNKIKQAQSGEKTTVAYIGGSITEGVGADAETCYAKLSYNYFAEKFGTGDNVEYVNAGLSGTPSKLGVLRLSRDVLSFDPDIVFIEFAVNDGNDALYQSAYESMVRRLLQLDDDVAVILLMSIAENGHTAQDYMKQIADYYKLPVISYADALTYLFDNDRMTWQDFSDDQSHPNKTGHQLVCDMIAYYFDTVCDQPQEDEPNFPKAPYYTSRQETAELFENTNLTPVDVGSFTKASTTAGFKDGWKYEYDGTNSPAVFNVTGKLVYMIFREQPKGTLGIVDVTVKCGDEIVLETQVNGIQSDAWGDPGIASIVMDTEVRDYTIEVKMAEGYEDKDFEILAFATTTE